MQSFVQRRLKSLHEAQGEFPVPPIFLVLETEKIETLASLGRKSRNLKQRKLTEHKTEELRIMRLRVEVLWVFIMARECERSHEQELH